MTNLSIELESSPDAAHEGRQAIRQRFADVLPSEMLHDLALVASELIANSVHHGPAPALELRVALRDDGSVFGEVAESSDGAATVPAIADEPEGLGLLIVDTIAGRWGVNSDSGTEVWFELPPYPRPDLVPP
jgi:two-component sensor histidine kinase